MSKLVYLSKKQLKYDIMLQVVRLMKKLNFNKILFAIISLLVILFTIFLISTNIIPLKYLILIIVILLLWLAGIFFLIVFKTKCGKNKKRKITGYILSGILVILMVIIFYYINITLGFFGKFGDNRYKEENYLVLVLQDSSFQELTDLSNIGYTSNELSNINEALTKLNEEITIENIQYDDTVTMFDDLINQDIDSVLIEESTMGILYEQNEDYEGLFRTIYTINIKTEIEITKETDVTNQPFVVYLSGIDSYGSIATVSRSDVNMIGVINPITKQVLLISIPRDYYVQLRGTTGYKDKLTHAGIYGIETSVGTLEDLLDVDVNYYGRVNFTSLEKIVDALGGIDVYSKYSFTSSKASGGTYYFSKGYNHMNGNQALAFSRERKALPGGDRARGENQQAVIDGIVRKAASPAIITSYSKILKSLEGTFQTNMSNDDIQKLIKMQLNDMASWNITSYNLNGSDGYDYTYSYPSSQAYVMVPDEETVLEAQDLIDRVIAGETLESSYDKEASDIKDPVYVEPTPEPEPEPEEPEITGTLPTISFDSDTITISQGQSYDLMTGVTVKDIEDELLFLTPTITVDITDTSVLEIGNYTITYTVTDSDNNTVTATRNLVVLINVIDDTPTEPEPPVDPETPTDPETPVEPENPTEPVEPSDPSEEPPISENPSDGTDGNISENNNSQNEPVT